VERDKARTGTNSAGGFITKETPARCVKDALFKSLVMRLLFGATTGRASPRPSRFSYVTD
jgi:hypothetical protein